MSDSDTNLRDTSVLREGWGEWQGMTRDGYTHTMSCYTHRCDSGIYDTRCLDLEERWD